MEGPGSNILLLCRRLEFNILVRGDTLVSDIPLQKGKAFNVTLRSMELGQGFNEGKGLSSIWDTFMVSLLSVTLSFIISYSGVEGKTFLFFKFI